MNNYKACISGAHSQGKTTLINRLQQDPLLASEWKFSFQTSITRSVSKLSPINESGDGITQYLIFAKHLELALTPGRWIVDRSALDVMAYTRYLSKQGKIPSLYLDAFGEVFLTSMKHYNRIFYIVPELELKEDGQRSTQKDFFDGVVSEFAWVISPFLDKVTFLSGSVEERANKVVEVISKDMRD